MKIKQKIVTFTGVFLAVAMAAGIWALATSNYGTENDPLITLSYITDVLTGQIEEKINQSVTDRTTALESELNAKIAELESINAAGTRAIKYAVVSVYAGQTLICNAGTEVMLRVGNASCTAPESPGLINTSSGSVLENGAELEQNHMYMVTIDGRGVYAKNDIMLIVRGGYSVS